MVVVFWSSSMMQMLGVSQSKLIATSFCLTVSHHLGVYCAVSKYGAAWQMSSLAASSTRNCLLWQTSMKHGDRSYAQTQNHVGSSCKPTPSYETIKWNWGYMMRVMREWSSPGRNDQYEGPSCELSVTLSVCLRLTKNIGRWKFKIRISKKRPESLHIISQHHHS